MKNCIIFCVSIICTISGYGQILNQDASGKSSIVWQGSSINIDITESLIKLNHYGQFSPYGFFGVDMQAKNETGVADLFKEGGLTPHAKFSGLIGFRKVRTYDGDSGQNDEVQEAILDAKKKAEGSFDDLIKKLIRGCPESTDADPNVKKIISEVGSLTKLGTENLLKNLAQYSKQLKFDGDEPCKKAIINQIDFVRAQLAKDKNYEKLLVLMEYSGLRREAIPSFIKNSTTFGYLRAGVNATEFTYDQGRTIPSFDLRFRDTLQIGANFELGLTHQKKMNYLGFNLGYIYTSNFNELEKGTYAYVSRDSSMTSGVLTQPKNFTAYKGDYLLLGKIYINIDYLRMIGLGQSHYLLIGPFLRQDFSLKTPQVSHNTILGIGANYINGKSGKLLLGVYLQSDNIRQESNFKKTIRFGLNTRISLSSIFPSN